MSCCEFEGCGRKQASRGLCAAHYQQRHRFGIELRPIRQWRPRPVGVSPRQHKADWHLLNTYGLTRVAWDTLFDGQGRVCAMCSSPSSRHNKGWAVDHCHDTNTVRGILCQPCNTALGYLGDDLARLYRAVRYVEDFDARR